MQTAFLLKNHHLRLVAHTIFEKKKAPTTYQADGAFAEHKAKRTAVLFSPKFAVIGSVFEPQVFAYSQKMGVAI